MNYIYYCDNEEELMSIGEDEKHTMEIEVKEETVTNDKEVVLDDVSKVIKEDDVNDENYEMFEYDNYLDENPNELKVEDTCLKIKKKTVKNQKLGKKMKSTANKKFIVSVNDGIKSYGTVKVSRQQLWDMLEEGSYKTRETIFHCDTCKLNIVKKETLKRHDQDVHSEVIIRRLIQPLVHLVLSL